MAQASCAWYSRYLVSLGTPRKLSFPLHGGCWYTRRRHWVWPLKFLEVVVVPIYEVSVVVDMWRKRSREWLQKNNQQTMSCFSPGHHSRTQLVHPDCQACESWLEGRIPLSLAGQKSNILKTLLSICPLVNIELIKLLTSDSYGRVGYASSFW